MEEELQVIMLIGVKKESMADSSIFSTPQDSINPEYLHWEEDKVST